MDTIYVQLCVLITLFLGNAFAGFIPNFSDKIFKSFSSSIGSTYRKNRISAFFTQFGGGMLMSICLLVLIPESQGKFGAQNHQADSDHGENHKESFPIPEFIVLCGYFLTFAVEEVFHRLLFHCRKKEVRPPRVRFCSCAKRHTECSRAFKADHPEETLFGYERRKSSIDVSRILAAANGRNPMPPNTETNLLESSIISQAVPNYGSVANVEIKPNDHIPVFPITTPPIPEENEAESTTAKTEKCYRYPSSISNVLLLLSISIYSMLQGVLIGTMVSFSTWTTTIMLGLQQIIIHLTLGNIYALNKNTAAHRTFILLSSLMGPFGILISMFLSRKLQVIPEILIGCVCSLVCGCLLYLSFNDLLRRHVLKKISGLEKLAAFSLGTGIIALLLYVPSVV